LKCADCHGVAGSGGSGAPYTYVDPKTHKAFSVTWRAPALNTVLYRFSPLEVHDIITYGRPGTPMQAWGVLGGGPKNDQSINDLLAYIQSIQLPPGTKAEIAADMSDCTKPPKTATGGSSCALITARKQADDQVAAATSALTAAKAKLAADQKAFAADQDPSTKAVESCSSILAEPAADTSEARVKCRDLEQAINSYTDASGNTVTAVDVEAVNAAQSAVDWAKQWKERRTGVTDGQMLFEINCARCHTKNWSIFDPTNATLKPEDLLGPPGGGGSLGFNLREGEVVRRFQTTTDATGKPQPYSGLISQIAFVINGSDANKSYGVGGIGSGRMPGQCNDALKADSTISLLHYGCMLTYQTDTSSPTNKPVTADDPSTKIDDIMIEQIVLYERCGIDLTDDSLAPPKSDYATNCS